MKDLQAVLRQRVLRRLRAKLPRLALFLEKFGRRDPDAIDQARIHYFNLVDALLGLGEIERAKQCCLLAVRHGVWRAPLQTPKHFLYSVPDKPIHDKRQFPFVKFLEDHYRTIRSEIDAIMDPAARGFRPVKEEDLVGSGSWEELVFYEGGQRFEKACRLLPATSRIVSSIPEIVNGPGAVGLSWLRPGTHIRPHCGPTNAVLRGHLGIKVPPDCSMRVRDETVIWEEGKCVVFDHSYEHEVWNRSNESRVVLLFDMFHPSLTKEEKDALPPEYLSFQGMIEKLMRDRGVREIERCDAKSFLLRPDEASERVLVRYFDQLAIQGISLSSEGIRMQGARTHNAGASDEKTTSGSAR